MSIEINQAIAGTRWEKHGSNRIVWEASYFFSYRITACADGRFSCLVFDEVKRAGRSAPWSETVMPDAQSWQQGMEACALDHQTRSLTAKHAPRPATRTEPRRGFFSRLFGR